MHRTFALLAHHGHVATHHARELAGNPKAEPDQVGLVAVVDGSNARELPLQADVAQEGIGFRLCDACRHQALIGGRAYRFVNRLVYSTTAISSISTIASG